MATGIGFYALAGAAAGLGSGIAEEGRQSYESMREELRAKRAAEEAEKGRRHQTSERVAGEGFRAGESELDRAKRLELQQMGDDRADKRADRVDARANAREDRAASRFSQFDVDNEGFKVGLNGRGQWERVKDAEGKPYKPKLTAAKDPEKLTAAERAKVITDARKAATDDLGNFDEEAYKQILRDAGVSPATAPASGVTAASQPKGAGTEKDPYTAATQAEVDWFKKNAPAGARIVIDGKTYTKQ